MPLPRRCDSGKRRDPTDFFQMQVVSKKSKSLFVQLALTESLVFFVEGKEKSERNEHI
jgi:hypothetical protein